MNVKVITDGELTHILNTFEALLEEVQAIDETTDHVFTTGAMEMIDESVEIITALKEYSKAEYDVLIDTESVDIDNVGC